MNGEQTNKEAPTTERLVALLLIVLTLSACDPVTTTPSKENVEGMASRLTYFKDGYGICYATVSSTSYGFNRVAAIATVPCEKVGL